MRTHDWTLTNGLSGFGGGWRRALGALTIRLIETALAWQARAAERAQLAAMDDRLLRDVGLSRADVMRESSKPFWTA
jgi:uncharacterized protein YjiS (DUF1127 family)